MDINNLRTMYMRFGHCRNLNDTNYVLQIYIDFIFSLVQFDKDNRPKNECIADSKMILQMIGLKLLHIKDICKGVYYEPNERFHLSNIIDPTTTGNLARNIFEIIGTFNLIYRNCQDDDKLEIVYNLWVIGGLTYRQNFKTDDLPENLAQRAVNEEALILRLKEAIIRNKFYKILDENSKQKILTRIDKKEFKIQFKNNTVKCLDWKDLHETMGIKSGIFDTMYNYLSLYTHASNVSVFQFAQAFTNDDYLHMVNFQLQYILNMVSIFIADYIKLFPKTIELFEKESIENQLLLDQRNYMLRKAEYSINESFKILG